jgi:hypothetical protein
VTNASLVRVASLSLAVLVLANGVASADTPDRQGKVEKVPAASGKVLDNHWRVGFFGAAHGQVCSWIAVVPPPGPTNFGSEGSVCGRWEAPGIWKPVQGDFGDGDRTVSLYLTDLDVARVKLLVKRRGGGSSIRTMGTRRLGRDRATRARVRRDFRYVVLAGRGELCVVAVTAYDRAGRTLDHQRRFCET